MLSKILFIKTIHPCH